MADEFPITPELLREYISETRDILDGVDAGLLALERAENTAETINDVMRGFHSVKGSSGFLRQTQLQTLAHAAEDVVSQARDGGGILPPDHIDVLLVALDYLRQMLREIEDGTPQPTIEIDGIVAALHALSAPDAAVASTTASQRPPPAPSEASPDVVAEYVRRTVDKLSEIESTLTRLETETNNAEALAALVTAFRELKESARTMQCPKIAGLAQATDELLTLVREHRAGVLPDHIDAVLVVTDYLRNILGQMERHGREPDTDIAGVVAMVRTSGKQDAPGRVSAAAPPPSVAISADLLRDYVAETRDILEQLDTSLLALEASGADEEAVNVAFRAFHSIKGTSGFLGLTKMIALAHAAEELLARVRDKQAPLIPDHVDTLLVALDYLRSMVDEIEQGVLEPTVDIDDVVSVLRAVAAGAPAGVAYAPLPQALQAPVVVTGAEAPPAVIRSPSSRQDDAAPAAPRPTAEADTTVRIGVRRLDAMLNLVGELLLARNRLNRTTTRVARELSDVNLGDRLATDAAQVSWLSKNLEAAILQTRMLPVARAFRKLPRIVRDAAREAGKEVILEVSGEDTELDRALIEEIADPLVHLVRNAIDHGIEAPDDRERAGKPRCGRIRLSAYHEGNRVVIRIEDDGGGIDPARVRDRAVQRGIMADDAVLTDRETLDLIFQPGFSTRDTANNLSGRGVGLDVVRTNVQQLNGLIEVETAPSKGSTFLMKIPLTLAVVHVMIVGIGDEVFAVPTSAILEAVVLDEDQVTTVEGRPFTMYGEDMLPLIHMRAFLSHAASDTPTRQYMLVLASAERRAGVLVDRLVGQQEVIVKRLGRGLQDTEGVAGAVVLDDGRVCLVLDVAAIVTEVTGDQVGELPVGGAA